MSFSGNGLPITLEFSGGAELLVGAKKNQVALPPGKEWTIKLLLHWIRDNLLQERPELFLDGDSVRPGILVLVNDEDWELLPNLFCEHSCDIHKFNKNISDSDRFFNLYEQTGQGDYKLKAKDTVLFISTLHGG